MSKSSDFGRLQLSNFRKFSEKISAIAYHNGKIAVALACSNQRIEVWNYASNTCELTIDTNGLVSRSLKFDENVIVSMFEDVRSWDIPSGISVAVFKGDDFRCCSFDCLKKFNIVVGSFTDSSVYIWNMSTGDVVKRIALKQRNIQRVCISPECSDEAREESVINLLILRKREINLMKLKFNPSDMRHDTMLVEEGTAVHPFPNPWSKPVCHYKFDSLRIDQKFLYYLVSSDDPMSNKIIVWDVNINFMSKKIQVNRIVQNLLAAGEKYIAIHTGKNEESFIVVDKASEEVVATCHLPRELHKIGADSNPSVIIGETTWLDDLDGENSQGVICLCVCNREMVRVLKLVPKDQETSNESSTYCNLL